MKSQEEAARLQAQQQQAQTQTSAFPTQAPESVKRSIQEKIASFMGIEKAGQGLATAGRVLSGSINQSGNEASQSLLDYNKEMVARRASGAKLTDGQKSRLQQIASGSDRGYTEQSQIDTGSALSNKEVIGSFGNVALNVAMPTAFKGGLGAQAAKSAALGAGFGTTGGMNDKEDIGGIIKSTITGAVIGGAIPVVGKAIGKVASKARKAVTQNLPESLMNHAVKPTLNELKKNIKTGSETLGKELLDESVSGSPKKLLKISDSKLTSLESELQSALKSSKGTITREKLRPYFEDTIKTLQQTPGSKDAVLKVEDLLVDVPETMSLETANVIKRNLYSRLRDVAYKIDPSLSDKANAMKVLARGLKVEIENNSDNPELIKSINKKLSIYGRLEDRVVDILARDGRNNMVGLTDTILGGAGFVNPLAWVALLGKHASTSTRVLTKTAKVLNRGKNIGTGKTTKVIKEVTKRALYNAQ
jgi:hypothetical protein